MKSSNFPTSTFENLQLYKNKQKPWFFLWLLGVTSIFSFFILYTPNNPLDQVVNTNHQNPFKANSDDQKDLINVNKTTLDKPEMGEAHDEKNCNLFIKGQWIPDLKGPLYTNWSCSTLPESKNCGMHGRKDVDYMNWRWKPDECELPRFDSKTFLSIVQGKKLAFIGDSVARNQMESLLCLLSQDQTPQDIYKDSEDRFRTFYFPSHNFTLMVIWTKFMAVANERVINGSNTGAYDIHLDKIDNNWAEKLPDLDYAVISTGHWFFRKNYLYEGDKLVGCIYCNEPNVTNLGIPFAIGRVFKTTLKFIYGCKDCKDDLFTLLRTFSPSHFEHGSWDGGGICNRTSPYMEEQVKFEGTNDWKLRSNQVKEFERIHKKELEKSGNKKKRFDILDITRAMMMRPDGHPGPFWDNKWMKGYNDCTHWCLPGPIDVWNDLLMAVLLQK